MSDLVTEWAAKLARAMSEHEEDCPAFDAGERHSSHLWVSTYPLTSNWQSVFFCEGF